MAERNLTDRLDDALDALLGGATPSVPEPELAMLLAVASDLRGLPDPAFRSRLRASLAGAKEESVQSVIPYFVLDGADDFIAFVQQAFGGELALRVPTPEGRVMHAEVQIGDSKIEVGNVHPGYPIGTRTPIHLYIDNVDEVYARAVAAGATTLHALTDQPYGDREASLADRWGNHWYIASPVREGFRTVTPFFHPAGSDRLIDFLTRAFGAQPVGEIFRDAQGVVRHAALRVGQSMVEMGEAHDQWGPMPCHLHFFVDNVDAVYARAVEAGGKDLGAPQDMPYGQRIGHVEDPAGNVWFIAQVL
jgi:PhnB protein